jgi:dGTPase
MDSPRQHHEEVERTTLSPRARLSSESKGRDVVEAEDELRTCFQRDRDRIVHCKAFRRLGHKTQVFLAPEGDHYRVRLTHTLEVTQVARTIARALRLNFLPGFRHNLQSVRVVEVLERLNLTWEVRDGIANHTWSMPMPETLEGQIARFADRIAYINHDIDDAVRANILKESDLPEETLEILGRNHRQRMDRMVHDLVGASMDQPEVSMSPSLSSAMATTRSFLFERVYLGRVAPATQEAVRRILETLLEHYAAQPSELDGDPKVRSVDYVAGMTDRFAIRRFEELAGEFPGFGLLG